MSKDKVEIDAHALYVLVSEVDAFWSDHKFAQREDNHAWVEARDAMVEGKRALGGRFG